MANGYNDFVNSATTAGVLDRFTEDDLLLAQKYPEYGMSMLNLLTEEGTGTTAEQRALLQEAMNQLRVNYQTKEQIDTAEAAKEGAQPYTYGRENEYQDAVEEASSFGEFSYDPEQDDIYRNLRQNAIRNSQRVAEDTLARASVGTGGAVSSYAISAATQAANKAAGAADDALPTLRANALNEWNNNKNIALSNLSALSEDRQADYERYLTELGMSDDELKQLKQQFNTGTNTYLGYLGLLQDAAAANSAGTSNDTSSEAPVPAPQDPETNDGAEPDSNPTAEPDSNPTTDPDIYQNDPLFQSVWTAYPDGVITNEDTWNMLMAIYGFDEAAMNQQGFYLNFKPKDPPEADDDPELRDLPPALPPQKVPSAESVAMERVKQMYPDGVTDAASWDNLEKTYGADALEAYGIKPKGFALLPKSMRDELKSKYPSGKISSQQTWNNLLAMGVTESELNAAGYIFVPLPSTTGSSKPTSTPIQTGDVRDVPPAQAPATAPVTTQKAASTESVAMERLKQIYPNGVADAASWENLEKTYGADALEAYGIKPKGFALLPKSMRDELKSKYPSGKIFSQQTWNNLLAMGVTESELNAAGYSFVAPPSAAVGSSPVASGRQLASGAKTGISVGGTGRGFYNVKS